MEPNERNSMGGDKAEPKISLKMHTAVTNTLTICGLQIPQQAFWLPTLRTKEI